MWKILVGCIVVVSGTLTVHAQDFGNPAPISIPSSGTATPYPSPITVSGIGDQLVEVAVTLTGLDHTYPDDIDILLVGPSGASVILMSDAGSGFDLVGVTLTFSDAASGTLPDSTQIVSGTYRPTNYGTGDTFAAPAPPDPYGSTFAGFVGTNPNGEWQLFVVDDSTSDAGQIAGGWMLHLTAIEGGPAACCFPSGECQMITAEECTDMAGTFLGPGTACGPESCLGACCTPDGACLDYVPQTPCSDMGGLFRGFGSQCAAAACPPYGDQCFNAIVIPELPFSATGNTCDFNDDYDSGVLPPACPYSGSTAKDVVYRIDSFFDVYVEIDLCNDGTDYDTKLYVYQDDCVNPPIACADDVCSTPQLPSNYVSRLDSVHLLPDHTYYIVVDGYNTACGNYTLTVNPVLGACCSPGGSCQMTTGADCTQGFGYWQGPLTTCDPNPCMPFNYYLEVDDQGALAAQAGDGYPYEPGGEFYYYPQTLWFNMWWPNEFDLNRQKVVNLDFLLDFPSGSGYAEIAINYGTDAWTAQGFDRPPLPADVPTPDLEDLYIGRLPLGVFEEPGHYTTARGGIVLPYCPSWVSVDIRGYGFVIVGGIVHECQQPASGACCVGPACSIGTPDSCAAIGGAYMGDGTDCFPNPCLPPPEYWLQLAAGGLVEQGGTGFDGQWFYYPDTLWYNMWWPNEFDLTREKLFTLEFDLDFPAGAIPPTVAFTYSTLDWDDLTTPPLPPLDQYIVRQPVDPPPTTPGHYVYTTVLPYCPGWVSIDVAGDDVAIQGSLEHVCLSNLGACCYPDGHCEQVSEDECNKMHYPQPPDPSGWDVMATRPAILADDFLCTWTGPLTHVRFWGSWQGDAVGQINTVRLSVHADIPADESPTGFSMPGPLLWSYEEPPGPSGTEPVSWQGWFDPAAGTVIQQDHQLWYQYDIDIPADIAFVQQAGTIYWLDLQVTTQNGTWGWKTSTAHWNDDAVWGLWSPGQDPSTIAWQELTDPITGAALDMAFEIGPGQFLPDVPCEPNPCVPPGGACCVGWECSIQPDSETCVSQLHGRYMGDGTSCDPNPCPITDTVVCEPQGDGNPVHPPTYWYDVTPGDFGRCDFHVRVYDPDPANYTVGPMPPTWQFLVHTLPNGETWASWWDPDCSDAIFGTFRFQFTHYGPSEWGDWTTTIGANNDPYDQQIDASWHHTDLPDGYGYRVHVPLPAPTGACCIGLACTPDLTQSQCESQGGIWQGAGSDCFPNPCLPIPADYWLRLVNGEPVEQGGTGFDGMWFFYPDEAWWNMWWPNEFDLMREKQVTIDFWLDYPPPGGTPPFVALNYSTPEWPDPTAPPLPPLDEFITRAVFEPPIEPGHHVYTMTLPYCPMWVSVDVRGSDLQIEGTIVHECLPRPCLDPADSNCDGAVNAFDIDPFVLALTAGDTWLSTYRCDYMCANDVNCDGSVNAFDIDPFVRCLTGAADCSPCP